MRRWRWVTGFGVVAALAGVVIFMSLQRRDGPVVTTSSTSSSVVTSTTEAEAATTTVPSESTSTTTEERRKAEVEALLKDLWFGWFDAIYRKDPDALWQVVATTRFYEDGVSAMETMEFTEAPTIEGVTLPTIKVLLDRSDCLVVEQSLDFSAFRGPGATGSTVTVLWPDPVNGFRFATSWQYANDLWLADCDNLERQQTP